MLLESSELDQWHKEMNSEANVPPKGFRRNTVVYPLVCFINNIIGCYISKNITPIPLFIERSRIYMEKNPPGEALAVYYKRVNDYLDVLEKHLKNNGVKVDLV